MGWPGFMSNQPKRYFAEERLRKSLRNRLIERKMRGKNAIIEETTFPEKGDREPKTSSSSGRMLSYGVGQTSETDDRGASARLKEIKDSRNREYGVDQVAPVADRDLEAEADETERRTEIEETANKRIGQASLS